MTEDQCRAYEVDGEPVRVHGGAPLSGEGQAALAEIVRAAKRRMERSLDARIRARLDLVRQHMTDETRNPLGDGVSPLWNDAGELASALLAVLDLHKPVDRGTGPHCTGCATHVTFTPYPCKTVQTIARNLGIETP